MDKNYKQKVKDIVFAIALLILADALIALGIVSFLFVATRIPVKMGINISWLCFGVIGVYILDKAIFKKQLRLIFLRPIQKMREKKMRREANLHRYEMVKVRMANREYRQNHKPYYELAEKTCE